MIEMLIVIHTATALGAGEQVFLTGSLMDLGHWNPRGMAMIRVDATQWEARVGVQVPEIFEFKVTRGDWSTEAVDAAGAPLPNQVVDPSRAERVDVMVAGWKDERAAAPASHITGTIQRLPQMHSRFLELDRDVIVWFPPGYDEQTGRRYPVLYMHDGRQVFDPATSTWGKDWQVDEHAQHMILNGEIEPVIVVAVDCTDARMEEYAPSRKGGDYLRFLMEELKPFVDARWRTIPERSYIAGASMGGLISFYAAWTHPEVYKGAACLSPAFVSPFDTLAFRMVEESKDALPDIRLFLSCGGAGELEGRLLTGTLKMAELLKDVHFPGQQMSVRIESWAEHNEEAWERMTPHWLRFLFGRQEAAAQPDGR